MSIIFPELEGLEDIDPWEIRSHTNYGATGLLDTIAKGERQRQQSRQRMMGLIGTAERMQRATNKVSLGSSQGPDRRGVISAPGNPRSIKGKPRFQAFVKAIFGQESGGNYGAVNSSSGAAGKYQILPGNFVGPGGWDREAGLKNVTLRQFMNHPRIQDRIALHKLREYVGQYGYRGAAQAWYGGPGAVGNDNISGGSGYPTTGGYADQIIARMRAIMNRRR